MITRFVQSVTFITAIFLLSGGLSYLMSLDGVEFREIDRNFVVSTPLYLFSNLVGVFGLMGIYETHRFYLRGNTRKTVVRLMFSIVLLVLSLWFSHILFTEALRK